MSLGSLVRLAYVFAPPILGVLIVLLAASRFKRAEKRILQTAVVFCCVWMAALLLFTFATAYGDRVDSVRVRNHSSETIEISGGPADPLVLAPSTSGDVDAVNGLESIKVTFSNGRIIEYDFVGELSSHTSVLTVEDVMEPTVNGE